MTQKKHFSVKTFPDRNRALTMNMDTARSEALIKVLEPHIGPAILQHGPDGIIAYIVKYLMEATKAVPPADDATLKEMGMAMYHLIEAVKHLEVAQKRVNIGKQN